MTDSDANLPMAERRMHRALLDAMLATGEVPRWLT